MNKIIQANSEVRKEAQASNKENNTFAQAKQSVDNARAELKRYNAEADRRDAQAVGFGGAVSAIAEGAMNEFADRTVLGRIVARPFMDTPGEQSARLSRAVMTAEKNLAFNRQEESNRIAQEQAWQRNIGEHKNMMSKYISGSLDKNPRYMAMTDKQKAAITSNSKFQDYLRTKTLLRMGVDVFQNGKDRGALDYYAKKFGLKITEKNGKNYIQFPGKDGKIIEINHTNFAAVNNAIDKDISQEVATLVALKEQEWNLPGMARGQKIHQVSKFFGNSAKKADDYQKTHIMGYSGDQQRTHYAAIGIKKLYADDGKISNSQEKEELLAQLSFLAKKRGDNYTQNEQGDIFIINEDGSQTPIKKWAEETLMPQDVIQIEWNKKVQGLNLEAMQKAQLETAEREAKLEKLGHDKKTVELRLKQEQAVNKIKQLDKGNVLNSVDYDDSEKDNYKSLLNDISEKKAMGWSVDKLKTHWDKRISDSGISSKKAIFPYAKEYYPKAIETKRKQLGEYAQKASKAAKIYSDYKNKYNNRPSAIMKPGHPDYASSSTLRKLKDNWKKTTIKRNELSKEISKLEERSKEINNPLSDTQKKQGQAKKKKEYIKSLMAQGKRFNLTREERSFLAKAKGNLEFTRKNIKEVNRISTKEARYKEAFRKYNIAVGKSRDEE